MSDERTLLPGSIQQPHLIAFDLLMKQRLNELQLSKLLVYLIDSTDENALYWLAKQFDLLGYNGWKLADTVQKKRDLIKKGIELHRYKGTIWSIKEALKTVGFGQAAITEHVTHWAGFTIDLGLGQNGITAGKVAEALEMVKAYKNVRSHLLGFEFRIDETDNLTVTDDSYESAGEIYADSIFTGSDFIYNGAYQYDGSKNYSQDQDLLEITITNV